MTVLVITAAAAALIGSILTAITGGVGIYANYKQNQENMSAQQAANQFNVASQERINNANIKLISCLLSTHVFLILFVIGINSNTTSNSS